MDLIKYSDSGGTTNNYGIFGDSDEDGPSMEDIILSMKKHLLQEPASNSGQSVTDPGNGLSVTDESTVARYAKGEDNWSSTSHYSQQELNLDVSDNSSNDLNLVNGTSGFIDLNSSAEEQSSPGQLNLGGNVNKHSLQHPQYLDTGSGLRYKPYNKSGDHMIIKVS